MDIIGEARDTDELVALLRRRKADLQLSDAMVDELAGLTAGHTGKLLGPAPVKQLGAISLSALLGTLALKLVVVIDLEQAARIGKRWKPRLADAVHPASYSLAQARPLVLARSARKAAKIRWAKMSPRQKHEHMAMMTTVRLARKRK